jgi:hypothetical protein
LRIHFLCSGGRRQQQAADADPILAMLKSKRKGNHAGPLRQLKPLEHALLRHVFEQREQGITVQTFDLVDKASSLSPGFNAKHFIARCSAVKRFMCANLLVYHMGTHETQLKPKDVATEASDDKNPLLERPYCDRRFILNMDHMPVFFCMTQKKTLDVIGVKTVLCQQTTQSMRRSQ